MLCWTIGGFVRFGIAATRSWEQNPVTFGD